MSKRKFGAIQDPDLRDELLASRDYPGVNTLASRDSELLIREIDPKRPVVLLEAVTKLQKDWRRGAQGIGDCLSWAFELGATVSTATDIVLRKQPWLWRGEFATEPIYGGARVEARGKSHGGWSDGASGSGGAAFITRYGCLRRHNYSLITGLDEHDLQTYSAEKAKQWGAYGCGGRNDNGLLDNVAMEFPVKECLLVNNATDARRAILNGYPVVVCSGQGFTATRDDEGFCKPRGSWAHAMLIVGYFVSPSGRIGFIIANSWGVSNKGPCPYSSVKAIQNCSFGVDYDVVDSMLSSWNDSWLLTGVNGLERREIKWTEGWELAA